MLSIQLCLTNCEMLPEAYPVIFIFFEEKLKSTLGFNSFQQIGSFLMAI